MLVSADMKMSARLASLYLGILVLTCVTSHAFGFYIKTNASVHNTEEGSSVTFSCEVEGDDWEPESLVLCWFKVNKPDSKDPDKQLMTVHYTWMPPFDDPEKYPPAIEIKGKKITNIPLQINDLNAADADMYECTVGGHRREQILIVKAPGDTTPDIATKHPDAPKQEPEGGNVTFPCNVVNTWDKKKFPLVWFRVNGVYEQRIMLYNYEQQWPFNTQHYPAPKIYQVGEQDTFGIPLTISNVTAADEGTYECVIGHSRLRYSLDVPNATAYVHPDPNATLEPFTLDPSIPEPEKSNPEPESEKANPEPEKTGVDGKDGDNDEKEEDEDIKVQSPKDEYSTAGSAQPFDKFVTTSIVTVTVGTMAMLVIVG